MGRSPFGGGLAKLEWEVKPRGTLLDGAGTATSASWAELAGGAAQFSELVDGLSAATPYHWRARLRYEGASTPYQQFSRWITVPLNGWNETDLRTAAPPPVDADGDGYASDVDCDDGDPDVWRIPGEADSLRLAADEQTFSWEPPDPAGGTPESVRYDLLRSPVSIDFVGAGACAATDVVETSAVDGTSPAPGERLFYLVRAENACGAGSLGLDSAGSERAGRTCP